MYRRSPANYAGFTLLELQIALLLLAMITVLMVGALRLATQTWNKVTVKQDVAEHRFLVAQTLRRLLNSMRFVRVRTTEGQLMSSFLANQTEIHFVAPFPTFRNDNVLYWWTLTTDTDPEENFPRLVIDYLPFSQEQLLDIQLDGSLVLVNQIETEEGTIDEPEEGEPQELVLADRFLLMEAQFYIRDDQGVEEWLDEWEPSTQAPLVVRLLIAEVDKEGSETMLPEIAVAPRFSDQRLYNTEAN